MKSKYLRDTIKIYLASTGSTLKKFVVDILLSEATEIEFARDEPDATDGQKWDANQPLKVERVSRFISGKKDTLDAIDETAIVTFLASKNYLDLEHWQKSSEEQTTSLEPILLRNYVSQHRGLKHLGETHYCRFKEVKDGRGAALHFWNGTEFNPVIRLSVLTYENRTPGKEVELKSVIFEGKPRLTQYTAVPIFALPDKIFCHFFQPDKRFGEIIASEITLLELGKNKLSTRMKLGQRVQLFCNDLQIVLKYLNKVEVQLLASLKPTGLFSENLQKEGHLKKAIDNDLQEAAKTGDIVGFINAIERGCDINAVEIHTGSTVAHIAASELSIDVLGLIYGSEQVVEDILTRSSHFGHDEDLLKAKSYLGLARINHDAFVYDNFGKLPSEKITRLDDRSLTGEQIRNIHAMMVSGEMTSAQRKNSAFNQDYTLSL